MSTQAIGSAAYMSTYKLLQAANEQEQLYTEADRASKEADKSATSALGNDIAKYLAKIPKGDDGKLSFKDVDDYRAKLAKEWDDEVKKDLKKLGVDVSEKLPLSYDTKTGKITVTGKHKDKATIEKYLADNPDKVEGFKEIIQLGKLTSTANSNLSQSQMVQNIQYKAMTWWFADNSDPKTWFSGGGMMLGGMSTYSGLNLKV